VALVQEPHSVTSEKTAFFCGNMFTKPLPIKDEEIHKEIHRLSFDMTFRE
jgi:hypothetical protein